MSIQVDGNGNVSKQGDSTEFSPGVEPVTRMAPQQGEASQAEASGDRPSHWPQDKNEAGEYLVKSEGEMASWYAEQMAQAKAGGQKVTSTEEPKAAEPEVKTPEVKAEEPSPKKVEPAAPLTDEQIAANLKEAGGIYADEKYLPFAIEVERTGALTPESLAKAAEAFGVPPEFVKTFVDGQLATKELHATKAATEATAAEQARTAKVSTAILSVIPDPSQYDAMMTWGAGKDSTVSQDVKDAYDAALQRGDDVTVKALVGTIKAAFEASGHGPERRDITQGRQAQPAPVRSTVKPFGSKEEQIEAQGSRKYATDPGYRTEVNARIAVSDF